MAGAPAGAAGRRRLAVRAPRRRSRPGTASCSTRPRRRSRRASEAAFRRANAFWIEDWGGRRQPSTTRFASTASGRRCAPTRPSEGVRLIGDVPIYVAQGSVDHRAHPELFLPGLVAGAPPDKLGPLGQHWGNPLFDWDAVARDGYRWWIERLRRTLALFDLTRIDHFRGFAEFWAIPEGAPDARAGRWLPGPGAAVFEAAEAELGPLPVIAEDLGLITPDVHELRDRLGFPGMVVLLWAFQGQPDNPHRFENHREQQVIYTTTHDTDTLRGHFRRREPWGLIELALSSRAALAMIPLQDVLELGSEARMNTPGSEFGNWTLAARAGQLTDEHAARLRAVTAAARR